MDIVYVLTNPAMPGLVKIGLTSQEDANTRIGQLYTTGVPVPFSIEFACKVPNGDEVEQALHRAFAPNRVNPNREFFQIDPTQAIAILRLLHVSDATQEVTAQPTEVDNASLLAAAQFRRRRPNLNFEEMQIPVGSVLQSIHGDIRVTVVGPRKVQLEDAKLSLTDATRQVLKMDRDIAPCPHWTFEGRNLSEYYEDTYSQPG